MKKFFAALMFFLCVPLAGAQSSSDVVLQKTASPEEFPPVLADWQKDGAANAEVVSINVLGVMGHRIAVSQNHPSGALSERQYVEAFIKANSALMPENGVVKLETFLTLARAGKLRHPSVTSTATNEAASAAVVAAAPVMDTVARNAAVVASNKADAAWVMANNVSVEVEKFQTSRTGTDLAVLRRLAALEKGLKEVPTAASFKALEGSLDGLKETFATQAGLSAVEIKVDGQRETIDTMTANLKKVEDEVDVLTNAPAKGDGFARLMTGMAIVLTLGVAFILYRYSDGIAARLNKNMEKTSRSMVEKHLEQPLANFRARIDGLEEDVRAKIPEFEFPYDFLGQLEALDAVTPSTTVQVEVDSKPYHLKFTAVKPGYVTVEGIDKLTRADFLAIETITRTIKRQWGLGRLKGCKIPDGDAVTLIRKISG